MVKVDKNCFLSVLVPRLHLSVMSVVWSYQPSLGLSRLRRESTMEYNPTVSVQPIDCEEGNADFPQALKWCGRVVSIPRLFLSQLSDRSSALVSETLAVFSVKVIFLHH